MNMSGESDCFFIAWARKDIWTIEDACTLIAGKNPTTVNSDNFNSHHKDEPRFVKDYYDLLDTVLKAVQSRKIKVVQDRILEISPYDDLTYCGHSIDPVGFIEWAKSKRIPIPTDLEEAVIDNSGSVEDWKSKYEDQIKRNTDIQAQLQLLEEQNQSLEGQIKDLQNDEINPQTKRSLEIMVITMAMTLLNKEMHLQIKL